jgi:antitoxin component YwqK of YwqJK toxin-antitoxin module
MKLVSLIFLIGLLISVSACAQNTENTMIDSNQMYSMAETFSKYNNGQQYFLRGSDKPFTGFLYAKYDNGHLESVQQFVDGVGNGIWINFAPDGKKECQGTYVNNRVEGPVTFYYEDGSIKSVGQYRDWKRPIGVWTFYDRQGNVVSTRRYTQ